MSRPRLVNMSLLTLCLVLLPGVRTFAATPTDVSRQFQEAKVHEEHGDYEEAFHIYQTLYQSHRGRVDILYRLESVLTRLDRHQEVVDLLTERLRMAPKDLNARLKQGDALLALGRTEEAFAEWEQILKNPSSESSFLIVADRYRKHNLHDRVESIYRRARKELNAPRSFARELARLAERKGQYDEAVTEYLRFVEDKPQYRPVVVQHLREFATNEGQRMPVFNHLALEVRSRPTDRIRSLLLVEYAEAAGLLAPALRVLLDHPDSTDPEAWLKIARSAQASGQFETAAGAYARLLQRPNRRPAALLGLGIAEEGRNRFHEAKSWYETLVREHPHPPIAQEARYRLGRMLFHKQGDIQGALEVLLPLTEAGKRTKWRDRAAHESADLLVRADRMDEARNLLQKLAGRAENLDDSEKAVLMLAEIDFLDAEFEASGRHLSALLSGAPTRFVLNDAVELSSLLQQGTREFPGNLKILSGARRDLRQGKASDALSRLNQALDNPVRERAGVDRLHALRIRTLQILQRPREVVEACLRLLDEAPLSPICPGVRITLAETFERDLHLPNRAREAYERTLVDYPMSLETDIARERIRLLRAPLPEKIKEAG